MSKNLVKKLGKREKGKLQVLHQFGWLHAATYFKEVKTITPSNIQFSFIVICTQNDQFVRIQKFKNIDVQILTKKN